MKKIGKKVRSIPKKIKAAILAVLTFFPLSGWFYIFGLGLVTAGVRDFNKPLSLIVCGSVMLFTSVYSYIRRQ